MSLQKRLDDVARDYVHPCIVRCDADFGLIEAAGDTGYYQIDLPPKGGDIREGFPFLYAIDAPSMSWPLMQAPSGRSMDVAMTTQPDGVIELQIVDVSGLHDAQQSQQQIANEARIMNYRMQQITDELKQARAELHEANQLKSRFIAGMSHEFRTPLTSVLGYAGRIRRDSDNNPQFDGHVDAIERGARHLLSLVDGLLEQGRLESDDIMINPVDCNLRGLVGDIDAIIRALAGDRGLQFSIRIEGVVPDWIRVDEMRLRQLIVNLCGNAVKFTDHGGVHVALSWASERLDVTVKDSGGGIPPELQDSIFMPFKRAVGDAKQGAGLGLAICRKIAERMEGTVELVESSSAGSCFRISIAAPRAEVAEQTSGGDPDPAAVMPVDGALAVLVEDDEDISTLLGMYLEDAGFEVTVIDDGSQALASVLERKPSVLVTDMNLPGLDGATLVSELRAAGFESPVVALSGSASAGDQARAIEAGCDRYLVKPLPMEDVIEEVMRAMQVRGARR